MLRDCLYRVDIYTPKAEVIVVDNVSFDETPTFEKMVDVYIRNKKNQSFSKSINQGIERAKGEYICFLNDDVLLTENWYKPLLKTLKNKDVGVVGPLLLYPNGSIQFAGGIFNRINEAMHVWEGKNPLDKKIAEKLKVPREVAMLTFACVITKKEVIDKVGLLDENFWYGVEDWDYSLRVREKGYKLINNADSIVYHYHQATRKRYKLEDKNTENRFYFRSKWSKKNYLFHLEGEKDKWYILK